MSNQQYSDEEFLDAVPEEGETTTHRVASRVGCTPTTANRRLKQLHDEGKVYIPLWPRHYETTSQELEVMHPDSSIAQAFATGED